MFDCKSQQIAERDQYAPLVAHAGLNPRQEDIMVRALRDTTARFSYESHARTHGVALATAGAALALTAVAGGRTNVTTLRATVGPGFTISLTKNGSRVLRLKPGLYRITVVDRSAIHNFKLEKSGGAFERTLTSVGFKGLRTMTVRLTAGPATDEHNSGVGFRREHGQCGRRTRMHANPADRGLVTQRGLPAGLHAQIRTPVRSPAREAHSL